MRWSNTDEISFFVKTDMRPARGKSDRRGRAVAPARLPQSARSGGSSVPIANLCRSRGRPGCKTDTGTEGEVPVCSGQHEHVRLGVFVRKPNRCARSLVAGALASRSGLMSDVSPGQPRQLRIGRSQSRRNAPFASLWRKSTAPFRGVRKQKHLQSSGNYLLKSTIRRSPPGRWSRSGRSRLRLASGRRRKRVPCSGLMLTLSALG